MNKLLSGFLLVFFILIFTYNPAFGKNAVHELGKAFIVYPDDANGLNQGYKDLFRFVYPNGMYLRGMGQEWYMHFVAKKWIDKNGETHEYCYTGPMHNHPGRHITLGMTLYKKAEPATIIVNGLNITQPFYGKIEPSLKSDIYIDWKHKVLDLMGLESHYETWSYVNQNHDDYMIIRNNVTFTGDYDGEPGQDAPDQTIELAYYDGFSFDCCHEAVQSMPSRTGWGDACAWMDWDFYNNYMDLNKWPLLVTGRERDDLIISYTDPTDNKDIKAPRGYLEGDVINHYDNTGVPDPKTGMFLGAASAGFVIFHIDKSVADESDDLNEPKSVTWQTYSENWANQWRNGIWDFIINPNNRTGAQWEYEGIPRDQSGALLNMFVCQGIGPYTMSIGDNFTNVYAIGGGSIDADLCYTEGQKWWNWYWDLPGEKINNEEKNVLIAQGKDSLFVNLNRAYWTYAVKDFDIPDPLPVPDIEVTGGPDQIEIKWSYPDAGMYKDPDTQIEDFYQWKLYRKKGAFEVDDPGDLSEYNPYLLIGTFDKGTTSYVDKVPSVIRGVQYHYCVTAVDDGTQNTNGLYPGQKLESSYYANRTKLGAVAFKPGMDVSDEVVVVPNPYSVSTGFENRMNWPGAPNEIHFLNLPAYCTLKIYTVTGELIKTIPHTTGSGDETWTALRTDSNQYPASGVYIVVVDEPKDLEKNPLTKQFIKFVIVR